MGQRINSMYSGFTNQAIGSFGSYRIRVTIVIFAVIAGFYPALAQDMADIQFEKMDYNFGRIKESDGIATYNFKFTNSGKIPLIIQKVVASCGCTTPEWSHTPILPGKTGFIKVSYNTENRPGMFTKSITVSANIPQAMVFLTISGDVVPRELRTEDIYPVDFGKIRLASKQLSFVKVKDSEAKTDTLYIYNPGTSDVTIGFKSIPPHITIKTVPAVIPPKTRGYFLISFNGTKKTSWGFLTSSISLSFNGENKFDNAIKVSATVEEDFSKLTETELSSAPKIDFNGRTFDFGEIVAGKKVDYVFRIVNKGKRDLAIRSVSVSCDCLTAIPASNNVPPNGSTEMKVTFDSKGLVGMQNKIITVISNDPGHSTSVLRVAGSVKR